MSLSSIKKVVLALAGVILLVVMCVAWYKASGVAFRNSLANYVIPEYPAKNASLKTILRYFEQELAQQGVTVETRVSLSSKYEPFRNVRGISGNGYFFLEGIAKTFGVTYNCDRDGLITFRDAGDAASHVDGAQGSVQIAHFPLQVVEIAENNGWEICGRIVVDEEGNYLWTQKDIWNSSSQDVEYEGALPTELLAKLSASLKSERWLTIDGVPTCEISIDDTNTLRFAAVDSLLGYLNKSHPRQR